jgi:two-component system, OmpR family, response regulator
MKVLVADDDPALREVVRYTLDRAGYQVVEASDGRKAVELFLRTSPDLVVLDVTMPELDGLEVCRQLRAKSQVPILFLSSRGEEVDKILGLELGGDDYLTKPFSPRELASRVKALLRRASAPVAESTVVEAGGVSLDTEGYTCRVGGHEVELTVTEFRLLEVMMRRPGVVFTRDQLVQRAYEGPHHVSDRTLDSHVRRIRAKLREVSLDPIETVHGLGFRFEGAAR